MIKEIVHKIFSFNFAEDIKERDKKDGILAIIMYVYILSAMYLYAKYIAKMPIISQLYGKFKNQTLAMLFIEMILPCLLILPIILILIIRRQNVKSIGIKIKGTWHEVLIGIIFGCISMIIPIVQFKNTGAIFVAKFNLKAFLYFLYFLIDVALCEEIIFRGYMLTRLQGLIKNKYIVLVIGSLMFALYHIPFQFALSNLDFMQFLDSAKINIIFSFLMSFYYSYIYTRDNNIVAPLLAHAIYDFTCIFLYI